LTNGQVYNGTQPSAVLQPHSFLDQGTPVQNTWYTALDIAGSIRILSIKANVNTTGEDLELRLTIDGIAATLTQTAAAFTTYFVSVNGNIANGFNLSTTQNEQVRAFLIECRSLKIEVRKTTAAGVGNIQVRTIFQRLV
jgi:hypothetical protein